MTDIWDGASKVDVCINLDGACMLRGLMQKDDELSVIGVEARRVDVTVTHEGIEYLLFEVGGKKMRMVESAQVETPAFQLRDGRVAVAKDDIASAKQVLTSKSMDLYVVAWEAEFTLCFRKFATKKGKRNLVYICLAEDKAGFYKYHESVEANDHINPSTDRFYALDRRAFAHEVDPNCVLCVCSAKAVFHRKTKLEDIATAVSMADFFAIPQTEVDRITKAYENFSNAVPPSIIDVPVVVEKPTESKTKQVVEKKSAETKTKLSGAAAPVATDLVTEAEKNTAEVTKEGTEEDNVSGVLWDGRDKYILVECEPTGSNERYQKNLKCIASEDSPSRVLWFVVSSESSKFKSCQLRWHPVKAVESTIQFPDGSSRSVWVAETQEKRKESAQNKVPKKEASEAAPKEKKEKKTAAKESASDDPPAETKIMKKRRLESDAKAHVEDVRVVAVGYNLFSVDTLPDSQLPLLPKPDKMPAPGSDQHVTFSVSNEVVVTQTAKQFALDNPSLSEDNNFDAIMMACMKAASAQVGA